MADMASGVSAPCIELSILAANPRAITANLRRTVPAVTCQPWQARNCTLEAHRPYSTEPPSPIEQHCSSKEAEERKRELDQHGGDHYPRYRPKPEKRQLDHVLQETQPSDGALAEQNAVIEIGGRITAIRQSGKRLAFVDLNSQTQVMFNQSKLAASAGEESFSNNFRLLRRGDFVSVRGHPYIAKNGATSVLATGLPQLMAPCLQRFPVASKHPEPEVLQNLDRHVQMLSDPSQISTLKMRSKMLRKMREFFHMKDFVEVETPILSALAGGASARPFETFASEFPDRKLSLRIAPELWLKRLIVGGMTRIFEIGPCFRNEGLDKTHNPEFTTCEFYAVEHSLEQLMDMTQELLNDIASSVVAKDRDLKRDHETQAAITKRGPYKTIDFIPAINTALGIDLPNLAADSAHNDLLSIFESKSLPLPETPTLPRLLDKLSSIYLETSCYEPTWIIHIPECLSPLSKSFTHPTAPNAQPVAARAELFIHGRELVNCYEEENDPFAQRRKFVEQQRYARDPSTGKELDGEAMKIDDDYIGALEWGLPPTGGWGCGIDRLVMLFAGKERIGDVLTFGNLRAVTKGAERWQEEDTATRKGKQGERKWHDT